MPRRLVDRWDEREWRRRDSRRRLLDRFRRREDFTQDQTEVVRAVASWLEGHEVAWPATAGLQWTSYQIMPTGLYPQTTTLSASDWGPNLYAGTSATQVRFQWEEWTSNQTTGYVHLGSNRPAVPVIHRRHAIRDAELSGHPDPESYLEDLYATIAEGVQAEVMANADTWGVWRQWSGTITVSDDTIDVRATPHSQDPTDPVWAGWAERAHVDTHAVARAAADRRRQLVIEGNRAQAFIVRQRVAARRARALLLSSLDAEQRAMYEDEGRFIVRSQHGHLYEIRYGYAGNVYRLDADGRRVTRYCAHAIQALPDEDHMLGQKLMLETDELGFLRIANATALRQAYAPERIAA